MKSKRGISLIILVITIIIMIILTGAIILAFRSSNIMDSSVEAVFRSDIRSYQQILGAKKSDERFDNMTQKRSRLNGETLEQIRQIIPEFKEEHVGILKIQHGKLVLHDDYENNATDKQIEILISMNLQLGEVSNDSIAKFKDLKIGDYVAYSSSGVEYIIPDTEACFNDINKNNVYDSSNGENKVTKKDINWRVLNISDRRVTLISEEPIEYIRIGGKKGWLNAISYIDGMCKTLYSSDKGEARSLKVEDINNIVGYNIQFVYKNSEEELVSLPSGVKTIKELENSIGALTYREKLEEGIDIGDYEINYYTYNANDYKDYNAQTGKEETTSEKNAKINLIFDKGVYDPNDLANRSIWLTNKNIGVEYNYNCARFSIQSYKNFQGGGENTVKPLVMFDTDGEEKYQTGMIRPIVILNTNVKIKQESGKDGKSSATAWQLEE